MLWGLFGICKAALRQLAAGPEGKRERDRESGRDGVGERKGKTESPGASESDVDVF